MSDVVDLAAKRKAVTDLKCEADDSGPHLSGPARCGRCDHKWVAVAAVGAVNLECPNCHRAWGAYEAAVSPAHAWRCNCGNMLFWLTPKGAMCRQCGVISVDWAN